ncbi:hypothetical protein [Criibacterium bergeronii]|uniref:Uncharacterized protein n=1 Tax=Criibacterium bergeronii TaxID=1871336 RepID=A0A371IIW9_9FIRM|nr:hypothetical protein [Criibacterium bergeronii]RDY20426.1 hypothetical protein BBG48_010140 [Criibacterium bergeronii]
MTTVNIIDKVDDIQSDTEKLKFIVFQIQDFFTKSFDDINLAYHEKNRLLPLADILADYALIADRKLSDLKSDLQTK